MEENRKEQKNTAGERKIERNRRTQLEKMKENRKEYENTAAGRMEENRKEQENTARVDGGE